MTRASGHPTALAASELTAFAVRHLRDSVAPGDLTAVLRERCAEQRTRYLEEWPADLWVRPGVSEPEEFIARGWDECAAALDAVAAAEPDLRAGRACLTGAFAGAAHGLDAWPEEWAERIEHGDELAAFGRRWD